MPRVLYAVLNWGLGHASRSIPIIRRLNDRGAQIIIASDGMALHLLRQHFPQLQTITLPSLQVRYSHTSLWWNAFRHGRHWLMSVYSDHHFIRRWLRSHEVDGIISDHRLGIWDPHIPSVLIAHQLTIPLRPRWLHRLVNSWHHRHCRKYHDIWVPDYPDRRLSGALSHCPGGRMAFIGPQSQFSSYTQGPQPRPIRKAIAVLSGPEPFRTTLESTLCTVLEDLQWSYLLVRGTTTSQPIPHSLRYGAAIDFLSGEELFQEIRVSEFYIGRAGYSTLMDLEYLRKPALLITTPTQPEQVYLAQYHQHHPYWHFVPPEASAIQEGMKWLTAMPLPPTETTEDLLEKPLYHFINRLK